MTDQVAPNPPDKVPAGEIVLYQREDGIPAIEVRLEQETVWLTQAQLVDLFDSSKANISEHIKHIFEDEELQQEAVVRRFRTTAVDGKSYLTNHYNLDMVISVGYRVRSKTATQFRSWATERLREYLQKGFTMDDQRLKNLGGGFYWRELLERIRDIRASEKVLYRQVLDLYATSVDYNPKADETFEFFKVVQNKLHFAAHGHTAAEIVASRADADQPHMGLTSFTGNTVRKADVGVAKNYLDERELRRLNTLVSAYFDAAEFRAENHEPTHMRDWLGHLDGLITAMGASVLTGAGSVSHKQAVTKAEDEYQKYRDQQDALPAEVEAAYLDSVKCAQREIEGNQDK